LDWAQAIQSTVGSAADLALAFLHGAAPFVELRCQVRDAVSDDERKMIADALQREVMEYRRQWGSTDWDQRKQIIIR